jgi:membrane associated rhomboid family serine protease
MTTTPVGMRCPECSKQRTKVMRMRDMRTEPRVTYALIVINVIVFLAEGNISATGGGVGNNVYEKGALLGSAFVRHGASLVGEGVAYGQYYRIVTGGFLHENLLHIGFNMYVLYVLGRMLEPALGSVKFAVIYGVSLLAGSFGALLITPHEPIVGASGAVFGVMGAAAVEMRARKIPLMQSGVGGLILLNLVLSFTFSNISWGGHVGGLIAGAVTAELLRQGDRLRSQALAYAGCAVIAVGSVGGAIVTSNSNKVELAGQPQGTLTPAP